MKQGARFTPIATMSWSVTRSDKAGQCAGLRLHQDIGLDQYATYAGICLPSYAIEGETLFPGAARLTGIVVVRGESDVVGKASCRHYLDLVARIRQRDGYIAAGYGAAYERCFSSGWACVSVDTVFVS